ncbi:MAG: hypothetical protein ACRYFU_13035 [Janthinobacterium lividum]
MGPVNCLSPMTPLTDWQTFYQIVGSAAGALTGLQFVAAALLSDVPLQSNEQGVEVFTGPTIVHFVVTLLLAATVVMPWHSFTLAATVWGVAGLSGMVYVAINTVGMRRQTAYKPVFEDWLFHALLPSCAYAGLAASALCTRHHLRGALFGIAGVSLLLLVVGIHNSWDNLTFLVVMRRQHANDKEIPADTAVSQRTH